MKENPRKLIEHEVVERTITHTAVVEQKDPDDDPHNPPREIFYKFTDKKNVIEELIQRGNSVFFTFDTLVEKKVFNGEIVTMVSKERLNPSKGKFYIDAKLFTPEQAQQELERMQKAMEERSYPMSYPFEYLSASGALGRFEGPDEKQERTREDVQERTPGGIRVSYYKEGMKTIPLNKKICLVRTKFGSWEVFREGDEIVYSKQGHAEKAVEDEDLLAHIEKQRAQRDGLRE